MSPPSATPPIVAVADATYFRKKRSWGILVIRDLKEGDNLYGEEIWKETPSDYQRGVEALEARRYVINALVIDTRNGVRETFPGIPVQMYQFHQMQIITRYLTKYPKLPAGQDLRALALTPACSDEASFIHATQ